MTSLVEQRLQSQQPISVTTVASASFKKMTVPKRWEVATEHKLCFRCLADGHRGEACFRSRLFGLSGCRSAHHRMLHEDEVDNKTTHSDSIIR